MIGLLILQGVIFALWAVLAFRALGRIRARAVTAAGTPWPGLKAQFAALRAYLADPGERLARRGLLGLTVLVLALSAAMPWLMAQG